MKKIFVVLLLSILMMVISVPVIAQESKELNNVYELLNQYEREAAYHELLEIHESITFEENQDLYLEVLSYLINIEEYYWMVGDLTIHSIELYNLAMEVEEYAYVSQALAIISTIDYYNYENAKSASKLKELLAIENTFGDGSYLFDYYIGQSKLLMDIEDYIGARQFLADAEKVLSAHNSYSNINKRKQVTLYTNIAYTYEYEGEYELAQENMLNAMLYIDEADIEVMLDAQLDLIYYYIYAEDYDATQELFNTISHNYHLVSELYQIAIKPSYIDGIHAELAYEQGDYFVAATLYRRINEDGDGQAFLEDNIKSQDALDEFEQKAVEREINVYEQLKESQDRVIEVYQIVFVIFCVFALATIIGIYILLTQRKKLHRLSTTDLLTGISNRRHIMEILDGMAIGSYYVGLIDLDHFKVINDTYGHHVGDEVLEKVAKKIVDIIGSNNYAGRYGGEEFVIILNTDSEIEAQKIVKNVLTDIRTLEWSSINEKITMSVGLAYSKVLNIDQLLKLADEQLYISKHNGRDRYTYKAV